MARRHVPRGGGKAAGGFFRKFLPGLRKKARGKGPDVPGRPPRTGPSRAPDPNATPRGPRTDAHPTRKKDRPLRRENESADVMSRNGYDVEQNPPGRPNGKNPDYKIEGEYFDCYNPTSSNVDQVRKGISDKVLSPDGKLQADRIVLNMDDSPLSLDDVKGVLTRKPIADLKEVVIVKDGKAIPFFPFE